jgi:hypothetical protein
MQFNRIRLIGLVLVAVFAMGAVAAASASATEPIWTVPCHKVIAANAGKGEYGNSTCTTLGGSKEFSKKLLVGEKEAFESKQEGVQILKAVGITIECTKEVDSGFLIGGKPGTDETSAKYTVCTNNAGCTITEPIELIKIPTTLVWKEKAGGKVLDLFTPKENIFTTITLSKCTNIALNGSHKVEGQALAEVLNEKMEPVNALAMPPEEFLKGYLNFPCPPLKEYWTKDEPSREQHTTTTGSPVFKPLKFLGEPAEYCGKIQVFLTAGGKFDIEAE